MPPIVFFATLLPALVHGPLTLAAGVIRTISGALYTRIYQVKLFAQQASITATGLIFSARELPLIGSPQLWVDFITLIAQGVEWAFSAITTIPNLIIRWFDDHRNVGMSEEGDITSDFSWIVQIEMFRDALVEFATTVGQRLDELATGVVGTILDWAEQLLDPVGEFLANLYGFFEGTGYNPWAWIRANTPDIWTAFDSLFTAIRDVAIDWLFAKVTGLLGWLGDIAEGVLDGVGRAIGNFYGFLRGTAENPWDWIRANTPDIWTAFDSLFQAVGWAWQDRIDAILGIPGDILAGLLTFWDWITSVGPMIQAFFDDPFEFLFAFARGTIWPIIERWLITVWDGTEGAPP